MTTLEPGTQTEGLPVDDYDVVPKVYVDDADAALAADIVSSVADHEGEETVDGGTGPVVTVRVGVRSAFISWTGLEVVVSGHGYYEVEYDISAAFSAPLESVRTKSTWMTFDGLATGVTYYFRVRAVDASGNTSGWTVSPPTAVPEEVDTGDIADDAITTAKILDGAVLAAKIADGTLTYTEFASGIEPVRTYTGPGLPTLPDVEYPEGAVIFWTNDGKLYRNVADSWDATTAATDITGQLVTTQITDDAITTDKIAANAVTAAEIAADTITAGQIAAGAISTDELAANAVTADKILAGTITAASGIIADLAVDTLTSGTLDAAVSLGAGGISALGAAGEVLLDSAGIRMWPNTTRTGTPSVNLQASDGTAAFTGAISGSSIAGSTIRAEYLTDASGFDFALEYSDEGVLEFENDDGIAGWTAVGAIHTTYDSGSLDPDDGGLRITSGAANRNHLATIAGADITLNREQLKLRLDRTPYSTWGWAQLSLEDNGWGYLDTYNGIRLSTQAGTAGVTSSITLSASYEPNYGVVIDGGVRLDNGHIITPSASYGFITSAISIIDNDISLISGTGIAFEAGLFVFRNSGANVLYYDGTTLRSYDPIKAPDGSSSLPGYTFTSNTSTGFVYTTSTSASGLTGIEVYINGANSMGITRTGNQRRWYFSNEFNDWISFDPSLNPEIFALVINSTSEMVFGSGFLVPKVYSRNFAGGNTVYVSSTGELHRNTSTLRRKTDVRKWRGKRTIDGLDPIKYRMLEPMRSPKMTDEMGSYEFPEGHEELRPSPIEQLGLAAENVAEVIPEAAIYDDEGLVDDYDTRAVLAVLIEEVQNLKQQVMAGRP